MKKYYTPKLEEFHVGFEFEFQHSDYPESGWIKYSSPECNWELEDCPFGKNDLSEYRVKYLDEQDIEKLKLPKNVFVTLENDYDVEVYIGSKDIEHRHFSGTIKNKSELKKLMQQLGI